MKPEPHQDPKATTTPALIKSIKLEKARIYLTMTLSLKKIFDPYRRGMPVLLI